MPLTANFLADFSSFINAARDATTSTDELVAAAGKVGATLDEGVAHASNSLRTVGQGIADFGQKAWSVLNSQQVKQFGSDVATMVQGYIHEYSEAEAANNRLETALKNQGAAVDDVMGKYQELAGHLQKISTFSDEAITDAMSMFTTIGKVGPEEMQKVLEATMNLAAFMKIDLPAAANVMLKAAASDGESIGKLKILLGDAYEKGMNFNQIVGVLGEKLKGQFAGQLDTAAGRTENLKNRMSDLNEVIGEKLNVALQGMMDLFDRLPESAQTFLLGAYGIGKAIEPVLLSLAALVSMLGATGLGGAIAAAGEAIVTFAAGFLTETLIPGLVMAGEAVAAFVIGLVGWPAVIIGAIIALATAIYFYWDEIVAFLGKAVAAIKGFLTETLPKAFNSAVETVKNWYYQTKYWLYDQFVGLVDLLVKEPDRISDAFKWMFNNVVGFSYVPDMIDGIAKQFGRIGSVMVDPALRAVDDVNAAFQTGVEPVTLSAAAAAGPGGFGTSGGPVSVTVNMSGMFSTDDPQTRSMVSDLVSNAVMQGMRGGRLLGTA